MKVALCLSGQPRCALKTFPYILENIIKPNNADVFIHMNWDNENLYIDKSHADNGNCLLEKDIDLKIIELYKPIKYLIEKPKNSFNPNIKIPPKRLENFKKMNHSKQWTDEVHCKHMIKNMISMYYSIFKSNELKQTYANENGFVYDYVIRLRFDALPKKKLFCKDYEPDFIYYQEIGQPDNLISDWVNFGSNSIMNIYSSMYLNLEYINSFKFYKKNERLENTLEPSDECSGLSEHMIRDLFTLYKIPKKEVNINLCLA